MMILCNWFIYYRYWPTFHLLLLQKHANTILEHNSNSKNVQWNSNKYKMYKFHDITSRGVYHTNRNGFLSHTQNKWNNNERMFFIKNSMWLKAFIWIELGQEILAVGQLHLSHEAKQKKISYKLNQSLDLTIPSLTWRFRNLWVCNSRPWIWVIGTKCETRKTFIWKWIKYDKSIVRLQYVSMQIHVWCVFVTHIVLNIWKKD